MYFKRNRLAFHRIFRDDNYENNKISVKEFFFTGLMKAVVF